MDNYKNLSAAQTRSPSAHAQQTKQQIKKIFLALLKQKPVEQITIREITEPIYMNRSAFYRHFEDIYDLYYQVLDDQVLLFQEQLIILFEKLFTNGDIQAEDFPFQFFEENKALLQILLRDPKTLSHLKAQQRIFLKHQLSIDEDNTLADYELEYIISGQIGLVAYWMEHKMELPIIELFQLVKQHLLSSLTILQSQTKHL